MATVAVPIKVEPLKKSTVPAGETGPVDEGVIVAVSVTICPETGSIGEKVTAVVVVCCPTVTTVGG